MSGRALLVMAKAPIPGLAKTRLIPALGADGAAALQAGLIERVLTELRSDDRWSITLFCAPDTQHKLFRSIQSRGVRLEPQAEGDLGARMLAAFGIVLETDGAAVVVGTDCPELSAAMVDQAFEALESGVDAVLGPAEDGGYYLLGLRQVHPELFCEIPWSTSRVLECTRAILSRLGLTWLELDIFRDIDTPEDLVYLPPSLKDCCKFRSPGASRDVI